MQNIKEQATLLLKRANFFIFFIVAVSLLSACKKVEEVTYDKKMLDEIAENEAKVILSDSEIEEEKYILSSVTRGHMQVVATNKGYLYYPNREIIRYEEANIEATVEEVLVNLYDLVEEGDIIASVVYHIDPIELEKKRLELKRSSENIDFTKEEIKIELDKLKKIYDKEVEVDGKNIAKNHYETRKIELYDMLNNMLAQHELVKESTKNYEEKLNLGYITAPISGKITELEKTKVGQIIKANHQFGAIEDQEEVYLAIDNEQGMFRYNMEVDVRVTNKGNTKDSEVVNYKGSIITGSELLSWQLHSPKTYIQLHDGDLDDLVDKTIIVNGYSKELRDVLLVDKEGVGFDKKVPFIVQSKDGVAYKRNFIIGSSDSTNYVAIDGLEDKMELRLGIK